MVVIQGLSGDRTAYVTKVHHCLVDGVSGVELTLVLLDVSPSPPPPPPADPWQPKRLPSPAAAWLEGLMDQFASGIIALTEGQRDLLDPRLGLRALSEFAAAAQQAASAAMETPKPAPWNKPVGKQRQISFVKMPFHEVRAIRGALGGTVNDVVLTILGGALGRYLKSKGPLSEDHRLRLMIPVNVRTEAQRGTMGNRVSMMLPQVPVGIADPIARLNAIRLEMDSLKASDQGAAFDRLLGLVENTPAAFSAIAGRVGLLPGMINLACTNVPGPLIPLYGTGHRMLDFYPLIPLAGDLGLGIAILSYDRYLHWGICCDPNIVPDVDRIGDLVGEEFRALREAAGVQASDLPEVIGIHVAAKQVPGSQTESPRTPEQASTQRRGTAKKAAVPMQAAASPTATATVVKNKPAARKSSAKATPKVASSAIKATATSSNGKQAVQQTQKKAPARKTATPAVKTRAASSNGKRAAKKAPAKPAGPAQAKTKHRSAAQVKAATSSR
jgi:WS/DGAT/MGAT family acyltransferase